MKSDAKAKAAIEAAGGEFFDNGSSYEGWAPEGRVWSATLTRSVVAEYSNTEGTDRTWAAKAIIQDAAGGHEGEE